MEIDVARWRGLLDEIGRLAAMNSGFNMQLIDLERRRDAMAASLRAAESAPGQLPKRYTPIGQTPWQKEQPDPLAAVVEAAREAQLQEARDELARAGDELRHVNEQAATQFARLSRLRRLESACRQWASAHDVTLPGETGGGRRAIMQPSPPGRQFITPGATA